MTARSWQKPARHKTNCWSLFPFTKYTPWIFDLASKPIVSVDVNKLDFFDRFPWKLYSLSVYFKHRIWERTKSSAKQIFLVRFMLGPLWGIKSNWCRILCSSTYIINTLNGRFGIGYLILVQHPSTKFFSGCVSWNILIYNQWSG